MGLFRTVNGAIPIAKRIGTPYEDRRRAGPLVGPITERVMLAIDNRSGFEQTDHMKSVLEILADGLSKRNIQALLIGGHALQPYGVVRQTLDVDCLVADRDAGVVGQILVTAGYQERARTANFARYSHTSLYLMDVDVLLVDQATLQLMLKASRKYCMGAFEWRVPCLIHLVALKLHAVKHAPRREARDFGDIVELLRANRAEWQIEELKSLCQKYGPKDIYAKLEAALR